MFLHLGHVESSELGRRGALCEQANGGSLPEPLGQPGQVTVAVQVVGVEAAARRGRRRRSKKKKEKGRRRQRIRKGRRRRRRPCKNNDINSIKQQEIKCKDD